MPKKDFEGKNCPSENKITTEKGRKPGFGYRENQATKKKKKKLDKMPELKHLREMINGRKRK